MAVNVAEGTGELVPGVSSNSQVAIFGLSHIRQSQLEATAGGQTKGRPQMDPVGNTRRGGLSRVG